MTNKKRILSGVQPTGDLHIGNWLGAINNWVTLQEQYETFLCVVDLHAITASYNPKELSKNTISTAALYVACGIDPKICSIFVQSQISAHSELCWILNCMTPINWMERMIQFKEKSVQQGNNVSIGLFDYPILMAADILLYDANIVPVGKDQLQHLEMTRDVGARINNQLGDTFVLPQAKIQEDTQYVPGTDGEKMSKSKDNLINVFLPEKQLRKQIMGIKTDSTPVEDPKDPNNCTVFNLYALLANEGQITILREQYLAGGMGYGHAKQALFELILATFDEPRKRYEYYQENPAEVTIALTKGAEKARSIAHEVLMRIRSKIGY